MKKYFTLILLFLIGSVGLAQSDNPGNELPVGTEMIQRTDVKVFPNPATNVVNVLGLKNTPKANISVLDMYGNTVLRHEWAIRRNAVNLPISELPSGTYVIHIRSEVEHVRTKFYKK